MAREIQYRRINSWSQLMSLPDNTDVEAKSADLFSNSKWRLGILKPEYGRGRQMTEPILFITFDKNTHLYGKVHELIADNRMLTVTHLESDKILEYIEKYGNDKQNEPRRQFLTLKHKEYQSGGLSLESVKPIMTQQQWNNRDNMGILLIKDEIKSHLLKRKEQQLKQVQSKSSEMLILGLEKNISDSFDHLLIAYVRNLFNANLYYRKRKTVVNSNGSSYITIAPSIFHAKIKPMLLQCGGTQVGFKANHETWKGSNLSHDSLKYILNNGRDLSIYDSKGHKYEPSDGEIYYNIYNCRLVVKYMPLVSNTGVSGNQLRKHKRK